VTDFGGAWTELKLDKVTEYLIAYQKVMKNQQFRTVYIDAFCGDGVVKMKRQAKNVDEYLDASHSIGKGSAQRAMELESPFAEYHFIDKSPESIELLQERLAEIRPELANRIITHVADVNDALPPVLDAMNPKKDRVVLFVDPFGMQLDWSTISHISRTPIVDFWYLVPIGIAVNRLAIKDPTKIPQAWAARLDAFLGTKTWRTEWYQASPQGSLFGDEPNQIRGVSINKIEEFFRRRLHDAFPGVAKNMLRLSNKGKPMYTLMFACSNPSHKAQAAAIGIANHLLKG
jgi:three-Cys-motif partner protein